MQNPSFWLKNAILTLHSLVEKERKIGVEILELLYELERRKAYAELKYNGLFSFCVSELKFTEGQAYQRIQAMHALKANPQLSAKLKSGDLNVTTVSKVHTFLKQEKKSGITKTKSEVENLFTLCENKTVKEVKVVLAEMKGEILKSKLLLELDPETEMIWKEAKGILAHQGLGDESATFTLILKEWLAGKKKARSNSVMAQQKTKAEVVKTQVQVETYEGSAPTQQAAETIVKTLQTTFQTPLKEKFIVKSNKPAAKPSRYVPAQMKRFIFNRDQNQCKNCKSKYALQIDHVLPYAKNGTNDSENLRLLCRNCNLQKGIEEFGLRAMRR